MRDPRGDPRTNGRRTAELRRNPLQNQPRNRRPMRPAAGQPARSEVATASGDTCADASKSQPSRENGKGGCWTKAQPTAPNHPGQQSGKGPKNRPQRPSKRPVARSSATGRYRQGRTPKGPNRAHKPPRKHRNPRTLGSYLPPQRRLHNRPGLSFPPEPPSRRKGATPARAVKGAKRRSEPLTG